MSNKAPVDNYYVPYALYPIEPTDIYADRKLSADHAVYQGKDPRFATKEGKSLRMSGCHEVEQWLHDLKHKEVWPDGVESVPETPEEMNFATLLQVTGYMNREAYDLTDPEEPKPKLIPRQMYEQMRGAKYYHLEACYSTSKAIYTDGAARKNIAESFAKLAIGQLEPEVVEEVRGTRREKAQMKLAQAAITEGVQSAFGPMENEYGLLRKQGLLRPRFDTAVEAVQSFFVPRHLLEYFVPTLETDVVAGPDDLAA